MSAIGVRSLSGPSTAHGSHNMSTPAHDIHNTDTTEGGGRSDSVPARALSQAGGTKSDTKGSINGGALPPAGVMRGVGPSSSGGVSSSSSKSGGSLTPALSRVGTNRPSERQGKL